jgi:hypothetical protein
MQQVEIRVKGRLADDWSDWVGGLSISYGEHGQTTLAGPLPDQAALRGVLDRLSDLGLELISVVTTSSEQTPTIVRR